MEIEMVTGRIAQNLEHLKRFTATPDAGCTRPVSYTHLDVYKRQFIYHIVMQGIKIYSIHKMSLWHVNLVKGSRVNI